MFFAAEIWLLTALTGFTLGKRLLGIRVARLDGQPVGLLSALIRTVLLLLRACPADCVAARQQPDLRHPDLQRPTWPPGTRRRIRRHGQLARPGY